MKTTVDLADALFARAKRHARKSGQPLRALIEDGLRRVLDEAAEQRPYALPDRSVGDRHANNPLETWSWPELRGEIYGDR